MKKKLLGILVLVLIVALCTTMFVACGGGDEGEEPGDNPNPGENPNPGDNPGDTPADGKLAIPANVKLENGVFKWDAVQGADGYSVYINDVMKDFVVKTNSVALSDSRFASSLRDGASNNFFVAAVKLGANDAVVADSQSDYAKISFPYQKPVERTVTFNLNYEGSKAIVETVVHGEKVAAPATPERAGYKFDGWFRDEACKLSVAIKDGKIDSAITGDVTFYAGWTAIGPVVNPHVCAHPCPECGLCLDKSCDDPACADKCLGHEVVVHVCGNVCPACGLCLDDNCKDPVCAQKCEGHDDAEATISINGGKAIPLSLNLNAEEGKEEYMYLKLSLNAGDSVVITLHGVAVDNYKEECGFTGIAPKDGLYDIYVAADGIWVEAPKDAPDPADYTVWVIVNGNAASKVALVPNPTPDAQDVANGLIAEYMGEVTLSEGDVVTIIDSDNFEYTHYAFTQFAGTAHGEEAVYTFYAKQWSDGGDSVYVAVPDTFTPARPEGSVRIYYHNSGWDDKWSEVKCYYWKGGENNGWPGQAMTAMGDGWFYIDLEIDEVDGIIFTGLISDSEENKTKDLKLVVVDGVAYYNYDGVTELRPAE